MSGQSGDLSTTQLTETETTTSPRDLLDLPDVADKQYVVDILEMRGIDLNEPIPTSDAIADELHRNLLEERYNKNASIGIVKQIDETDDEDMIEVTIQLPFGGEEIKSDWLRPEHPESTWVHNVYQHSNADRIGELPGTPIPVWHEDDSDEYDGDDPYTIDLSSEQLDTHGWPPRHADTRDSTRSVGLLDQLINLFS